MTLDEAIKHCEEKAEELKKKADNYSNETSKWIKMSDRYGIYFACYKCGYDRERATTNFCPNCGAEMQKGGAK